MSATSLRLELTATGGTTTGFVVPDDVVAGLGGGNRPKVVLRVVENEVRTSIARMGGRFLLGLSAANRAALGVAAGDVVDLEIRLDDAPRTVETPADLAAALADDPDLAAVWEGWSYTLRKEAARQLTEAKKPETRASRLDKILAQLRA